MAIREYVRICKQAGCGQKFIVSAPSIEEDRLIGFSEPEYCPKHRAMHARSYSRIACHHYEVELTPEGQELVKLLERQKKVETQQSQELAGRTFDPWKLPGEGLGPGGIGRFQRPLRGFIQNEEFKPQKKEFQIVEKSEELLAALDEHQVVILVGTTGSGKSTYVPWLLLTGGEPGKLSKWARRGPICITQPRIQATQQIPRFIANSLNGTSVGMGSQIGFTHSKEDAFDRRSRLVFMTDGKLINSIVSGTVGNYSIVMIDEAHERSVNIELILGLLRDQLYLYPHLRVIIASATIDFSAFLTYFYPSLSSEIKKFENTDLRTFSYFSSGRKIPFVYSEGRRFPIVKHFWGENEAFTDDLGKDTVDEILPEWWKKVGNPGGQVPTRDQLPSTITELVRELCKYLELKKEPADDKSHILVFLPGSHEINKTVSMIRALKLDDVVVFPLYAQRPLEEQEEALKPDPKNAKHRNSIGKRRVVVSTNVAETSLTVEGVRYVIDTGYIKASYWNPYLQVSELQTLFHSKSGVRQRWGRAGRVSSGHSFMLYTRKQFEDNFPDYTIPEIARTSLEQVILTAKSAGVRSLRTNKKFKLDFAWMPLARSEDTQRLQDELDRAFDLLIDQGAIDKEFGDLTRLGLELRGMPAELDVARIFTIGEQHALGIEVATLLPFLNSDRGLQTVLEWNQEHDSYTKLRIRKSHLDFIYGCKDDLDIYLKLWTLWDRLTSKQRQKWAEETGINYKNFDEQIDAERRKLLEMAIDWRKAENRPIALHKLDTLRALIAFSLRKEIYQPASLFAAENDENLDRFQRSAVLAMDSFLDDNIYQEYDDEFQVDASCSISTEKMPGLYRRLQPREGEAEDSATIELAPISICFGNQKENDLVVICQRRANYMRPVKSKILGMNVIKIKRDWLKSLQGSLVERSLLYSRLTQETKLHGDADRIRLFLPWLLPRNKQVDATVVSIDPINGIIVDITFKQNLSNEEWVNAILNVSSEKPTMGSSHSVSEETLIVKGFLRQENVADHEYKVGDPIKLEISGYTREGDTPFVELKQVKATSEAFKKFVKKYKRKIDEKIVVEMCEILDDPLGRNPIFIVREEETGLEIPMSDTDFCGNNHPQICFGSRFSIGETFDVTLVGINEDFQEVYVSRGRQLLEEYLAIPSKNNEIVELPVVKVDTLGAYFALAGTGSQSSYIGFTRKSMWPVGFMPEKGMRVEARFRRLERSLDPQRLREKLEKGEPIPDEIDLGVDLDLLTPPAFKRYYRENKIGKIVEATVEKYLDSGGLLISVDYGLKAVVYPSDLGLDQFGRLKKPRDYQLGKMCDVLISYMNKYTARINCSISRTLLPLVFSHINEGESVNSQVVFIEKYYKDPENSKKLTCSFPHEGEYFPIEVICDSEDAKQLEVGSAVIIKITKCQREECMLSGKLETLS